MNPQLKELYKQTLLRHSKDPQNAVALPDADRQATLSNPLCGDRVTVYLKTDDSMVSRISFVGQCCSICTAAASMMTEKLANQPTDQALRFSDLFVSNFKDNSESFVLEGDLASLEGVREFPSRIRCATLPFETLQAALRGDG